MARFAIIKSNYLQDVKKTLMKWSLKGLRMKKNEIERSTVTGKKKVKQILKRES